MEGTKVREDTRTMEGMKVGGGFWRWSEGGGEFVREDSRTMEGTKVGRIRGRGGNEGGEDLKAWRERRWGGFEGGSEGGGRATGMYSDSENQSGTPDGEGLKKCATTGLYEPPPHRGKKHPS
jgi:hypothetical protein